MADRDHDASGMTAAELERTRRDLEISLALAFPGSPVRVSIAAEMSAIDRELGERGTMIRPEDVSMTGVVDCVERMRQFKQRCPGAEFDLKPYMFTARVPGRDEPFRAMSLCKLMDAVERWAAEEMARLLSGPGQPTPGATADDRLLVFVRVRYQ